MVFSSLIGFDVRFDAAKAGESGHSVLVPPVGNRRPERPVQSVSSWSRYTPRCPAPVQSDQRVQAPANGYAGGTLDMQAIVSRVLTFDSA